MDVTSKGLEEPLLRRSTGASFSSPSFASFASASGRARCRYSCRLMGRRILTLGAAGGIVLALLARVERLEEAFAESNLPAVVGDAVDAVPPPTAKIKCGIVRGRWEDDLASFRGIPYGVAPVGKLRWKPPLPATCWGATIYRATQDGHSCYQGGEDQSESEDCLNLNVFARAENLLGAPRTLTDSKELSPVFVWIYGGANVAGSVASYGSIENLVREATTDIVLVAMNYRVSIFGFLALEVLSADDPRGVSGNYGIADQQLALKWVQENIRAFGGDPNKVTIIGQSSGGTNVLAHLASSSSRGLFHRAVALSGSPNITMDRAAKEAWDAHLVLPATSCHHAADIAACLQGLSTHEIWSALPDSYGNFDTLYDYPTDHRGLASRVSPLVFVDGVTVTHQLEEALLMGLSDVPLLIQSTQAELDCSPVAELANLTEEGLRSFFAQKFTPAYGAEVAFKISEMYKNFTHPHAEYAVYAVDADACAACGNRRLVQSAREGFSSPVYWGLVTGAPDRPFDMYGKWSYFPFHAWDVIAATSTWDSYDVVPPSNLRLPKRYVPTDRDLQFGRQLRDQWASLALHGHLNRTEWKPVQDSQEALWGSLVGEVSTTPVNDMKVKECRFWESIGVDKKWWWIN